LESLEDGELRMVPMGSHIAVASIGAPGATIRGVDAAAVPTMGYDVKGLVGCLGGAVNCSGVSKEEGVEEING
jgi:hypothetical protein